MPARSTLYIDGKDQGAINALQRTIKGIETAGKQTAILGGGAKREFGQFANSILMASDVTGKFSRGLSSLAAGLATGGVIGAAFAGATTLIGFLTEESNQWHQTLEKVSGSLIKVKDDLEGLTFDFSIEDAVDSIETLTGKIDALKELSLLEAVNIGGSDWGKLKSILNEIGIFTSEELDINTEIRDQLEKQVQELKVKQQIAELLAKQQGFSSAEEKKAADDKAKEDKKRAEEELKLIEQRQKEWESLNKTLNSDIAKITLPEIAFRIYEIDQRFIEYSSKFPAHIALLEKWRDTLREATIAASLPTIEFPEELPFPELEILPDDRARYQEWSNFRIAEEARVSNAFLIEQALRSSAVSDTFSNMAGVAENFYELSGKQNKVAFGIFKAFAIAQAGVATYTSAIEAYKSLVGIPIVGPTLATAAAASAIAFGLSNIARIASMQPGSGVGGGSSSGGGTGFGGIPVNRETNNSDNRQISYVINIYGNPNDPDMLARDLIKSLNKAQGDGLKLIPG